MRTIAARDLGHSVSWLLSADGQEIQLPSRPRPRSLQMWINGLRATDFEPEVSADGKSFTVGELEEGDLVTVVYVPEAV